MSMFEDAPFDGELRGVSTPAEMAQGAYDNLVRHVAGETPYWEANFTVLDPTHLAAYAKLCKLLDIIPETQDGQPGERIQVPLIDRTLIREVHTGVRLDSQSGVSIAAHVKLSIEGERPPTQGEFTPEPSFTHVILDRIFPRIQTGSEVSGEANSNPADLA